MPQATAKDAFAQRLVEKDAKRRKKCLTELYWAIILITGIFFISDQKSTTKVGDKVTVVEID
ncbi:hypothetical protein CK516_03565 [Nostoc sp. 'Peltigera malacea cyanobiont' DB3992]|nr:hypothetical protein CK516_03565 [Nostoc sp. 'Peltigera malacea cyanobiont' DB3992]